MSQSAKSASVAKSAVVSASAPSLPSVGRASWVGWLLAIGATICFSIAPPIARAAIVVGMDPTALLVLRFLIAVALFAIATLLTDPSRFRIDRRGLFFSLAAGCSNGIAMLCFFWALTRLDASMTSMILSMLPLVVLGLLALRGEKLTRRHAMRVGIALAGVYLLIGPGGQVDLVGVGLTVVAVFLFSFQLVIIQWYLQSYDTRTIALYLATAMLVVISGWWIVQGATWQTPGANGWLAALALGVVATFIARMLFYAAIQFLGSGQTVLLMPLELLLTILWSVLFLDERFSRLQMVGGLLILTSALLAIKRLGRATWRPRWRIPFRS